MKKIRKFLATVGLSVLYIEVPTKIFDYPVSTVILEWQGPIYGFLVLYPCAVLLRYMIMLFYDRHCNDALGMQKEPPKPPAEAAVSRFFWYCKTIVFWAWLTYHEPLYIVLKFRKTKAFSLRTLLLLSAITFASCLFWVGIIDTVLLLIKQIF